MSGATDPTVDVVATDELGARAATYIAHALRTAVGQRGRATVAFSGGSSPHPMFEALVDDDVPWEHVHVLQVDERVAPDGHDDRNLVPLRSLLLDHVAIPDDHVHAMPVTDGSPEDAAAAYAATVAGLTVDGPLDVVHLGIGADGHTASLVPGQAVLDVTDRTVAATDEYQGRRRVTLTRPPLRSARVQLWLVAGEGKAAATRRMLDGDPAMPATGVLADHAIVLLDHGAASAR